MLNKESIKEFVRREFPFLDGPQSVEGMRKETATQLVCVCGKPIVALIPINHSIVLPKQTDNNSPAWARVKVQSQNINNLTFCPAQPLTISKFEQSGECDHELISHGCLSAKGDGALPVVWFLIVIIILLAKYKGLQARSHSGYGGHCCLQIKPPAGCRSPCDYRLVGDNGIV